MKHYYVYILSNWNRKVLYVGITNNLLRRIGEHQSGLFLGFTQKYHIHELLYFEEYDNPNMAIAREKQIKS